MGKKRHKLRSVWSISPVERVHEPKSDKLDRRLSKDQIRALRREEAEDEWAQESDAP